MSKYDNIGWWDKDMKEIIIGGAVAGAITAAAGYLSCLGWNLLL